MREFDTVDAAAGTCRSGQDVPTVSTATGVRYIVLFALDPESTRPAQRLVLMRRFLDSGLGPGIQILDQAFFPNYARVGFVILLEAESKERLLTALEPSAGVFSTTVGQLESLVFDPTVDHATYGVVGLSTPHDAGLTAVAAGDASAPVRIRLHAQLAEGGAISSITLVAASTFASALAFGRSAQVSAAVSEVARTEPMADYVTSMRASAAGEAFAATDRRANLVAAPAGDPRTTHLKVPSDDCATDPNRVV
jgi:hypothetical protein